MMDLLGPQNPTELDWYPNEYTRSRSAPLISENGTDTDTPSREEEISTIPPTPQKNGSRPGRNLIPTFVNALETIGKLCS